jgi:hypothetical protein
MMINAWGSVPREKFRRGVLLEVLSLMCPNLTGRQGGMKQGDAVNLKPTVDTSAWSWDLVILANGLSRLSAYEQGRLLIAREQFKNVLYW